MLREILRAQDWDIAEVDEGCREGLVECILHDAPLGTPSGLTVKMKMTR